MSYRRYRVNVGVFEPCTTAMGPGKRACLWVRGCSIKCVGCSTPELIPDKPATERGVISLFREIERAKQDHGIEGVSFSGGEPFDQAKALAPLARFCRLMGLSTLSWSGYTLDHLQSDDAPEGSKAFLAQLDVLIDGPFDQLDAENQPLRGSSNQRIHLFTDKYSAEQLADGRVQVTLSEDGHLTITGVTDYTELKAIIELLSAA